MNWLKIMFAAMLLLVVGCSDDVAEVQFSLDSYDVVIPSDGGEVSVTVISNRSWELTGYTTWCEPSTKSGRGSAAGEVITFAAGRADNDRSVTYRFHAGDEIFELRVSQTKAVALQPKGRDFFWVLPEGGIVNFEYETNMQCEVIIPESAAEWLSCDTRALGQRHVVLNVAGNDTGSSREASVEVRSTEVDVMSIYLTVRQPSTSNAIIYTTTDGKVTEPKAESFNAAMTNNLIYDGYGIMEFQEPLTEIRAEAFSRLLNSNLKTITLPESLEYIGDAAFCQCALLETIMLPESLRTIGDTVFQECNLLVEVTIPEGVTTIGSSLFRRCSRLRKVTMTDSVTSIGNGCFDECGALEEVRLSDNLTVVPSSTFYYCTALRKVNIPKAVEVIESYAFCACSLIEEVTLPEGLTHIGGYAFMSCRSLNEISIPEGVAMMDENCFGDCVELESVVLPESLTELGMNAFWCCVALREVVIPESITELKSGTFIGCESLDGVVLPEQLTVVGDSAFEGCVSLRSIEVPATVTHVNQSAFAHCYALERAVVRNAYLKQIQSHAFAYCSKLERVELYAVAPPQQLVPNIFEGCAEELSIYVPAESVAAYMSSAELGLPLG